MQQRKFNARRKFLWAILVIRAMVRIMRLKYLPEPLNINTAKSDPYRIKQLRKVSQRCVRGIVAHILNISCQRQMETTYNKLYIDHVFFVLFQVVDGCAFRVYGHWVKKGEGQNRAALFENMPKTELKHIYVTNLSR